MTKLFLESFNNRKDMSKQDIINALKKIIKELEKDNDFLDTNISDLINGTLIDDLEHSFLYLYLQICYAQEHRVFNLPGALFHDIGKDIFDNFPCKVYYSDKYRALLIDTPVILGSYRTHDNKTKENLLPALVILAVKNYIYSSGQDPLKMIGLPFAVCLYRRCQKDKTSASIPDIDNIEARKIINLIVRELNLDDSYSNLITNLNSIEFVKEESDCGTSILFVEESKRQELEEMFLTKNRSFNAIRV